MADFPVGHTILHSTAIWVIIQLVVVSVLVGSARPKPGGVLSCEGVQHGEGGCHFPSISVGDGP